MCWWHHAAAMALFALLLMPVFYRAGAATPHGHALLQLLHEGREGIPIHHHGVDRVESDHGGDVAAPQAGAPTIQIFASTGLLPLVLIALALHTLRPSIRTESDDRILGRSPAPEDPPPR